MLVRSIRMQGFMSHRDTELQLPECGLVLITGPNGSGKSSVIEAVSTAAFGKTLRGTEPWSGKGEVSIKTDSVCITRSHTQSGSKKLKWRPLDRMDDEVDYETNTKAQEALESITGDYQVWRRCSVFSSQDAAHFTMATDAQRKHLLESILGLGKFDIALAACRSDRKDAESKHRESTRLLEQLESQLESGHRRKEEAQQVLDTIPEPPDVSELKTKLTKIRGLYESAKGDVRAAEQQLRQFDRAGADEVGKALSLERQLDNLAVGNCDRCGQPITDELRAPLLAEYEQADIAAKKARAKAQAEGEGVAADLEELREEVEELRAKGKDIDTQINSSDSHARQRTAAEQAYSGACEALEGLQDRINTGRGIVNDIGKTLALVQTAEQVLGMKGVRAHVLGRALGGLEAAANGWLARVAGEGLRLKLSPYTERKTGGTSDAISLEIEGAGGGYGYKASSGGERRRIDVSLLLALAEVAQAAHGSEAGTIFADEVFDALDNVGLERVADVLQELAQDRTVVVISHNPDLQQALRPVMWLDVMDGEIRRIR